MEHSIKSLIAQRVYGLVQGYEDLNKHDQLRYDPIFALVVGKVIDKGSEEVVLAGKSTQEPHQHCPETVGNRAI